MEPRKNEKRGPKTPRVRQQAPKRKLRIVKLEERVVPKLAVNHNETLVREAAKAKPKVAELRKAGQKPKLQIVKLEGRIAPGINLGNHNETLVRDRG